MSQVEREVISALVTKENVAFALGAFVVMKIVAEILISVIKNSKLFPVENRVVAVRSVEEIKEEERYRSESRAARKEIRNLILQLAGVQGELSKIVAAISLKPNCADVLSLKLDALRDDVKEKHD